MPQPHVLTASFTTRGDEGDPRGLLSATSLLAYLEHMRWEVVWRDHHHLASLFADGRYGVVRAQHLRIHHPLPTNTPITCAVWIERVGRTSLTFGHRIASPLHLTYADAAVTWVHLAAQGTPHPLPDTIQPHPLGDLPLLTPADPPAPPPNPPTSTYIVRASEIDVLQHLNHASYARFVEDTRAALHPHLPPLQQLRVDYLAETRLGARVEVAAWDDPQDERLTRFVLRADQRPIAHAWTRY